MRAVDFILIAEMGRMDFAFFLFYFNSITELFAILTVCLNIIY